MWTLRRGHRHIGPDTFADYMDGRLGAAARTRVDQELASCASCRVELGELQATVSLLQQLPVEPVTRSFTMPAPPVQPVSPGAFAPLRMPQWVYAGAASAAAVVLAVLVSADATGLLEPGTPQAAGEIAVEARMAQTSPDQSTPIGKSAQVPAVTLEAERELSLQAAAAPPQDQAPQAAPEAAQAAPEAAIALEFPPPMPPVRSGQDDEEAKAPPPTGVSSIPVPVPAATDLATAEPELGLPPIKEAGRDSGDTAAVWRVLEGIAAALGLVFLGGLLLHRRSQRGSRPG